MNDLEITRLCAEAMGYTDISEIEFPNDPQRYVSAMDQKFRGLLWNPLHDDAQAMALVKKFPIDCLNAMWRCITDYKMLAPLEFNRAICEVCAKMMLSKKAKAHDAKNTDSKGTALP